MRFAATFKPLLPTPWAQLVAVAVGVLPLYVLAFFSGLQEFKMPDLAGSLEMLVFDTLLFTALILFLLYIVCGQSIESLQTRPGSLFSDISQGVTLGWLLLGGQLALGLLMGLFFEPEIPAANLAIASALIDDKPLMLLWIGPMIWIKAAFLEEFSRAFLLTRLWQIWPTQAGKAAVVIVSSMAFGIGHVYQGFVGVIGTALIGLILGWWFMSRGRLLPLIIAHGLYDMVILTALLGLVKYDNLPAI